ncbi:LytR/AlgR family response regulator transcription factor [Rhodoflexus sp.]
MKCLIVDDEPLACDVLENYIGQLEGLSLAGRCANAWQAISALQTHKVDLMFLDVQMPQLTGIDMLRAIKNPPQVILTTAFSAYALDAFDLDVADYLLKPFSFERFARAIAKARKSFHENEEKTTLPHYLFFKADKKLHKIALNEIILVEALSNYLKIYTIQAALMVRETMSKMETLLPKPNFARVHKSFIVAIDHIEYIEGNLIFLTKKYQAPIGESYKETFLRHIQR